MPDNAPSYKRLFAEMKRRRVFRVMAVYGALAFAVIEASDVVLPRMALPDWTVTLVVWLALLGFPVAIALAWAFDVTPGGLERTSDAAPGELESAARAVAGAARAQGTRVLEVRVHPSSAEDVAAVQVQRLGQVLVGWTPGWNPCTSCRPDGRAAVVTRRCP